MRNSIIAAAAAIALTLATSAQAQLTKTIPGERKTVTATVESIEQSSRQVQVKMQDGSYDVITVPDGMKRFDTLKVGDKITAKYYENIVLRLKAPGEKAVDSSNEAVTRADSRNSATAAAQRTITATITKIDMNVPSIAFSGPNGWNYATKVQDKKTLAKVKVGDKVDITWTEAAIVSIDDAK
jgi:hypothetical protein